MKFLCVPCDTPMKLQSVAPPERGSLAVVYSCPECGYEMAMLTNRHETDMVRSLGVRIGPAAAAAIASPGPVDACGDRAGVGLQVSVWRHARRVGTAGGDLRGVRGSRVDRRRARAPRRHSR